MSEVVGFLCQPARAYGTVTVARPAARITKYQVRLMMSHLRRVDGSVCHHMETIRTVQQHGGECAA